MSRLIYLKKNTAKDFEDNTCANKAEGTFFRKTFFEGLGAFLATAKPLIWNSFFFDKKLIL